MFQFSFHTTPPEPYHGQPSLPNFLTLSATSRSVGPVSAGASLTSQDGQFDPGGVKKPVKDRPLEGRLNFLFDVRTAWLPAIVPHWSVSASSLCSLIDVVGLNPTLRETLLVQGLQLFVGEPENVPPQQPLHPYVDRLYYPYLPEFICQAYSPNTDVVRGETYQQTIHALVALNEGNIAAAEARIIAPLTRAFIGLRGDGPFDPIIFGVAEEIRGQLSIVRGTPVELGIVDEHGAVYLDAPGLLQEYCVCFDDPVADFRWEVEPSAFRRCRPTIAGLQFWIKTLSEEY